jgi:hypothetical protein
MANDLQPVRPGDLITAQTYNDLVLKIAELEQRLDDLQQGSGGGTGLAVTGRIPATGPYRIGDTLTLLGRNFQFSLGAARVFLDAVRVLNLASTSSDTQLVFVIPPVPGVAEPGTEVTLRVLNQSEEVTSPIILRPALAQLFGEVDLVWLGVTPTTVQPDQTATFQFRITSRASAAADFLLTPTIGVASGQSTWQNRLEVLDASLNPLGGRQIRLDPLQARLFNVRISQVPSGTGGTDFTLTVNATAGNVQGTSGALPFQVGQAVEPPDTTIDLNPTQSVPASALVGDTVTASVGQAAVRVRFTATFELAGTYDLTLTTTAATTSWTVNRFLTTPASYDIGANDIPSGGHAVRLPEITIQPSAGASATGRVEVRLQRRGATGSRAFPLNLKLGV